MTKTLKWLLVILVPIIVGGGGWLYYRNLLVKPKPIFTNLKTFKDKKIGYSIQYPKEWFLYKEGGKIYIQDTSRISMWISMLGKIGAKPGGCVIKIGLLDLDRRIAPSSSVEEIKIKGPYGENLSEIQSEPISIGIEGKKWVFEGPENTQITYILFTAYAQLYEIVMETNLGSRNPDEYSRFFDQMLSTFKFVF